MSEKLRAYYYAIVFLGMLYAFYKARVNKTSVLIILVFWQGLFSYLSDITESLNIFNIYKIIVVAYTVKLTWLKLFNRLTRRDNIINIIFILFSLSFWISYLLYGGDIITILSQYLFKYGMIFLLYHYFKDISYNYAKRELVKKVLLIVIFIQIGLSIVKILLFGFAVEPIVGSMSAGGAGLAVVIPIVGLVYYWLIKGCKFTINEWIVSILIFVIAIASGKRQPILIYPIILFLLFFYVNKKLKLSTIVKFLLVIPLIFYLGVRLTPSLNPEQKIWGSFKISHIVDYSLNYYFGTVDTQNIFSEYYESYGRGGGVIYYFQPHLLNLNSIKEILFGKGRYEVAVLAEGRFTATGRSDYGIEHSGLMGEAGAMLYSFGYVGAILMVILPLLIMKTLKSKKLAFVIIIYFLWDFLFYYNQVFYSNQSAIIMLFIIFYANTIECKKENVTRSIYKKKFHNKKIILLC